VPDLVGLTLAGARSALQAADAGPYSWSYGCYGLQNAGVVVSQSPAGGTTMARTTGVEFSLQNFNCTFTMPDLVGLTLAEARSALDAADAGPYAWSYGCYGSPNAGLVVSQSPAGGVTVARTTGVEFSLQNFNC
jgi:eukaryotic-like serine/threonine-protein kinase